MKLSKETISLILTPLLNDLVTNMKQTPKPSHLVELVNICSKNKLIHQRLFDLTTAELNTNFAGFHDDILGDFVRSFRALKYYSPEMHAILNRELPVRIHEYTWWNLVDLGDYYTVLKDGVGSGDTHTESVDIITRIGNEIWKWIPDMRCGYAAKALRVISELDTGDNRTRRSLIRAIPKSLGKLHQNSTAESIVAASKFGHTSPRFYRRLSAKLVNHKDELRTVNADLIVSTLEALAAIGRKSNELFDLILADIKANPNKYTEENLVSIKRILTDEFGFTDHDITSRRIGRNSALLSIENISFLARSDPHALESLISSYEARNLAPKDLIKLLQSTQSEKIKNYALNDWLDSNLERMNVDEYAKFTCALVDVDVDDNVAALLAMKANNEANGSSVEITAKILGSLLHLSNYDYGLFSGTLFERITGKAVMSLETIQICQLIAAHMRIDNCVPVTDQMLRFEKWINSHLVSQSRVGEDTWNEGAVTDLSVFPVVIPVALPSAGIDLRTLHQARSVKAIRRSNPGDMGIAIYRKNTANCVLHSLRKRYLERLGWTVRMVDPDEEFSFIS